MSDDNRLHDPRVPPIGQVSQAERLFRANWVANEKRSPGGVPLQSPDFVSRQGRVVRLIDVREPEELTGPFGYIPGADALPREQALRLSERLGRDEPLILISRGGERSGEVAKQLEGQGMRFVASMMGGMVAWRDLGFTTSHDPAILSRRGELRAAPAQWEAVKKQLSLEDVERHVGDPMAVRWIKLAAFLVHGRLSCVDGRDDTGVLGTPGGDMGEFAMALTALERVIKRQLSAPEIRQLLLRRFETFGRYYLHSDIHASNEMIKSFRSDPRLTEALSTVYEALEWRRFLARPPVELREILLEHMLRPAHMGCGHMRLSLQRAEAFGTRPELILALYRGFFEARWSGAVEPEYTVLPGGHAEGAVVNVLLSEELAPFSRIPLVSPMAEGTQMFINHPQVSAFLRRQLAEFLIRQQDIVPLPRGGAEAIYSEMTSLGAQQAGETLGALAKDLPIYNLSFSRSGVPSVKAAGRV